MEHEIFGRPEYERQQRALDAIAAKLDVVCFRPSYHGKIGDKNTVLFYTQEDAAYNEEVDKEESRYSRSEAASLMKSGLTISNGCIYRDHFWSFENSDVNGAESYNYANFGKIDLRSPRWIESLEGAVRLSLAKRRQYEHIAHTGGWSALREADGTYNDLNREQIAAFKMQHGTAFLGNINFYDEQRQRVIAGEESVYEEYTGQLVYNFGCSFCTPSADEKLEEMIVAWNGGCLPKSLKDIAKITNRIDAIGGLNFLWY